MNSLCKLSTHRTKMSHMVATPVSMIMYLNNIGVNTRQHNDDDSNSKHHNNNTADDNNNGNSNHDNSNNNNTNSLVIR